MHRGHEPDAQRVANQACGSGNRRRDPIALDPSVDSSPAGIGTPVFTSMLVAAAAVVLLVVIAIVPQHR
jgi:hypothetical protein